ncbi:hypothetical protein PX52LOC_03306 [Limnoglobus roseus]|uniref:Zinc ribbon domain-containing protein n=1 Tax=Limnoglobus roseus TaxID=2598579 RepID=A0A5C1ADU7_9BACT|nr:hypothetical protein PX52LOC_03306 [Limnoglobus roseus]
MLPTAVAWSIGWDRGYQEDVQCQTLSSSVLSAVGFSARSQVMLLMPSVRNFVASLNRRGSLQSITSGGFAPVNAEKPSLSETLSGTSCTTRLSPNDDFRLRSKQQSCHIWLGKFRQQRRNKMYFPHCGRTMQILDGVYTCVNGDMPLSGAMHEILTQRFPVQRPRPEAVEVGRLITRWYCPGCGIPLDAGMVCTECGKSIHDQLFRLVELHPHADG